MTFEDFIKEWNNKSPYIEVKTSGSTGEPKLIRLSKSFVTESALRTNSFFSISSGSRLHSCVAADFIGGKMMAVRASVAGCRFSYEPPSNKALSGLDKADDIDLLAVVPSQMIHILDRIDSLPRLGAIIIGGSSIDSRLRTRIEDSGLNAYETYGMTETSSHIALRKIKHGVEWFETLDGITVSHDDRDCLIIHFRDGNKIVTNDLAEVKTDRKFKIKGRWDHVIITGGKKLNPAEVETKLSRIITSPFILTSEPDMKWGNKVVLRIEGDVNCDESVLKSAIRELLPSWQVPKKIEWVKELPRTSNGKLKRNYD